MKDNYGIFPFTIDYDNSSFVVLGPHHRGNIKTASAQFQHHECSLTPNELIGMAYTVALDGGGSMINGPLFHFSINSNLLTSSRTYFNMQKMANPISDENKLRLDKLVKRKWKITINEAIANSEDSIFSLRIQPNSDDKRIIINYDTPLTLEGLLPRKIIHFAQFNTGR